MKGVVGQVGKVLGGKGVKACCTVLGTATGSFEARAVDEVEVEGGVDVDVVGVAAAKVGDEAVGVVVVAIVNSLPSPL